MLATLHYIYQQKEKRRTRRKVNKNEFQLKIKKKEIGTCRSGRTPLFSPRQSQSSVGRRRTHTKCHTSLPKGLRPRSALEEELLLHALLFEC